MQPHSRHQKDAQFISAVAIAQGGANSASFDLGQANGGVIEGVQIEVIIPAVPLLSDTKVLTFQLQDSADNVTFAAVDPSVSTTVTGAGGVGNAAKTVEFPIPPVTRRYVRVAQTATATAGTLTGNFTSSLLF